MFILYFIGSHGTVFECSPVWSIVRQLLLIFLLTSEAVYTAQEHLKAEVPNSVVRIAAGILFHRTYSNISEKVEVIDDFTRITRKPSDSVQKMRMGFFLGGEAFLGKNEGFRGAFGLSLGRTGSMYHYSFTEEGPTSRPGYSYMKRATEMEYAETYWFADMHAGVRQKLFGQFYLSSLLVLTRPFLMKRETDGYVLSVYSVANSTDTESTVAFIPLERKRVKSESNLSFRFRVEYSFDAGPGLASAFLFRNLGLISTQPWWGFGGTYSF